MAASACLGLLAVAPLSVATACGDSSPASPGSSTTAGTRAQDDRGPARACANNSAVTLGFTQLFAGVSQDGPLSDAVKQQLKDRYNRLLARPLADLAADPPPAIARETRALVASAQNSIGASGDPTGLQSDPALQEQSRTVDLYFYDHCAGAKQATGAVEYRFSDLPDRLAAGRVAFRLTNAGKEDHEMLLVVRHPGVTQSFDQILTLPRADAVQKVDVVAQVSAPAGRSDATIGQLSPGSYLAFCAVPQGTAGDRQGTGPPHFALGMKQEITVN